MFEISNFIEFEEFEHKELFDDCEYFWDVINKLPEYLDEHVSPGIEGDIHPQTDIQGAVYIGEGTTVEIGVHIRGPAWIGRGCRIRAGAYIDGNIIIGDGSDFGHCCNAYKCVLMDYTTIFPMSFLGASIIGSECHLSAGCTLNALNLDREEIVVRIPTKEFATGLYTLGAMVGHHCRFGGGVISSPGTLVGPFSTIRANARLQGYYPARSKIIPERHR